MARVLVIMPTFDHGPLLRHSIPAVLRQSLDDFELLVIGDGAPDITQKIVDELATSDDRVRFVGYPKSPRTGEPYRDIAIRESDCEYVAYAADDDLWLPNHLEELLRVLADADFGHTMVASVRRDGTCLLYTSDAADEN